MFPHVASANSAGRRRFVILTGVAAVWGVLPLAASATERHGYGAAAPVERVAAKQQLPTSETSQTAATLRDLWVGHIFWVRNVSIAAINKNDGAMKAAEEQAVANAQSIAASIEPFYGAAAKDSFFKLLASHYGAVKAYLVATLAADASAQAAATQSLTSNAENLADFLSTANPHLPKQALHSMLLAHGGHHIQQIQQLKERNYSAEAKTWSDMKNHVYQIADATADALRKQFAKKY
jgi:hypothetical protein